CRKKSVRGPEPKTWYSISIPSSVRVRCGIELFALLLFRQLIPIQLFQARYGCLEACRIDEAIWIVGVPRLVLLMHIALSGMGRQPDVDFHFLLIVERACIRLSDLWKFRHAADTHARIDPGHVHNAHAVGLVVLADIEGEAGGSLGMAG